MLEELEESDNAQQSTSPKDCKVTALNMTASWDKVKLDTPIC